MRHILAGGLAALTFGAACLAAGPGDPLPAPLEGWTVSGPVYGESLIDGNAPSADGAAAAPATRIEISRDYAMGGHGLRISLNTHDLKGAQLIAYVVEARQRNPEEADALAAKGVEPFAFGARRGVTLKAKSGGEVTGAALLLGRVGTLTLEGVHDGAPAPVALNHVKAYLARTDLERMDAFVREANGRKAE